MSSIVNEVIRTILNLFFTKRFFYMYKNTNQTKTNQQNKIKQTKNNKGNNFSSIKTSKRGQIGWFWFNLHFVCRKSFRKRRKNGLKLS